MRWPAFLCARPCDPTCTEPCALAELPAGVRAVILRVGCASADAAHLRVLGVFEGARVSVVARRGGLLLDVCGSRLALDFAAAAAILAVPLAS
jgi:Fe2+ transport system protein FeoA